jgi:hypothetical protein
VSIYLILYFRCVKSRLDWNVRSRNMTCKMSKRFSDKSWVLDQLNLSAVYEFQFKINLYKYIRENAPTAQNFRKSLQLTPFPGIFASQPSQISFGNHSRITFVAFAIPDIMGYTKIEGVLLVTVISKILLPMVDFTIFGSSLHFAVWVDSATTAIIASGLSGNSYSWIN